MVLGEKLEEKKLESNAVPQDWQLLKLKKILKEASLGGNYKNAEDGFGIPLIKMGNLGRGTINTSSKYIIDSNETLNESHLLKRGDILFNTRNTLDLVGKVAIWNNEYDEAYYNSNLLKLEFDENFVASNRCMNLILNSYYSVKQLKRFATGTTSVAAIYGRDLKNLKILLPPKPEQIKIAEILSTLDDAIEKTQQLIEQLALRKKGLMQELLMGQKRLPGFDGEWKEFHYQSLLKEVRRPVKWDDDKLYHLISVRRRSGGLFN